MKLLARYPNNTKLLDSEVEDKLGNTQLLAHENGELLTPRKLSGVVYINEQTFEVYCGKGQSKIGIFSLENGFDWETETPRQKFNRAHKNLHQRLKMETEKLDDLCYCSFPRIIDYISNRKSTDSSILKQSLNQNFLSFYDSYYDSKNDSRVSNMLCKICKSEYEWNYRERGIDVMHLTNLKAEINGKQPADRAPNYLNALFDEVYCRESYIHRKNLEKADLETTINYLFERKKDS